MWGTMTELTDALASIDPQSGPTSTLALLNNAFGRVDLLHLRRIDTLAKAVSWALAEQTQRWHPAESRAASDHEPRFDRALIASLVSTIEANEATWQTWFAEQDVTPYEITYEDLAKDPVGVTRAVLVFLGLVLPADQTLQVRDRRQSEELNAEWIARFHG